MKTAVARARVLPILKVSAYLYAHRSDLKYDDTVHIMFWNCRVTNCADLQSEVIPVVCLFNFVLDWVNSTTYFCHYPWCRRSYGIDDTTNEKNVRCATNFPRETTKIPMSPLHSCLPHQLEGGTSPSFYSRWACSTHTFLVGPGGCVVF